MNEINIKLSAIKFRTIEQAMKHSIPIVSSHNGAVVAHLIPGGEWILNRTKLLMSIAVWRNKFMRFYLTQFKADLENATGYQSRYCDLAFWLVKKSGNCHQANHH